MKAKFLMNKGQTVPNSADIPTRGNTLPSIRFLKRVHSIGFELSEAKIGRMDSKSPNRLTPCPPFEPNLKTMKKATPNFHHVVPGNTDELKILFPLLFKSLQRRIEKREHEADGFHQEQ